MSRGNRKSCIFDDDDDRRTFLNALTKAARRYGARVYAWCLMPNHYHLVLDTPRGNLSDTMRYLNGVYTQASNRRHQRTGHVFEGRFRSIVVQRESYLRRVVRYVVLNPVRARLVADVAAWRWSSYRASAGFESSPPFLYSEWMAWAFPGESPQDSRRRFARFVTESVPRKLKLDYTLTAKLDGTSAVIGTAAFERVVRDAASQIHPDRLVPRPHRSLGRLPLATLLAGATNRGLRNDRIVRAHLEHGYQLAEIARFLGIHPSTVSVVVRQCERSLTGDDAASGEIGMRNSERGC